MSGSTDYDFTEGGKKLADAFASASGKMGLNTEEAKAALNEVARAALELVVSSSKITDKVQEIPGKGGTPGKSGPVAEQGGHAHDSTSTAVGETVKAVTNHTTNANSKVDQKVSTDHSSATPIHAIGQSITIPGA